MGTGAEIALVTAAVAGTAAQVQASRQAKKAQEAQADLAQRSQQKAAGVEKERLRQQELTRQRDAERARLKAASGQFGGRQSTILTGGDGSNAAAGGMVGGKTLLGT